MRVLGFGIITILFSMTMFGQTRQPPRTSNRDIGTSSSVDAERRLRQIRALEIKRTTVESDTPEAGIPEMYRKPSKEEIFAMAPPAGLQERYSEFLRRDGTGLVILNANSKCTSDVDVVSADAECAQYRFPGGGSSYSFRFGSYRIPRLADLTLDRDVIKTDSVAQQGILVDLGDSDIEALNTRSKGIRFLADFKPARSVSEIVETSRRLENGIEADGYLYRLAFFAKPNRTYALRSIAFPGRSARTYNGKVFNELSLDKREDVIVVFRVVDVARDGNVTILYRELSRKESPELKG